MALSMAHNEQTLKKYIKRMFPFSHFKLHSFFAVAAARLAKESGCRIRKIRGALKRQPKWCW